MTKIAVEREIHKGKSEVWKVVSAFDEVFKFHPDVRCSPRVGNQTCKVGVRRCCEFEQGGRAVEELVELEPERRLKVQLVESDMPLCNMTVSIELEASDIDRTWVRIEAEYAVRYGIVGVVMDWLMIRSKLRKSLEDTLLGLDAHLRTGSIVTRDMDLLTVASAWA